MAEYVDLHIHTDHSDGLQTPRQVVDRGRELDLAAVAITDHDTVSGVAEAAAYAATIGFDLVAGIELSASTGENDDIHLLGYFINIDHPVLVETLERFRRARLERGRVMVKRLADLGLMINYDDVIETAGGATVGRPHLAEVLVKDGLVSSYHEAFNRYLYLGGPVYVPKSKLSPSEAIGLIHETGGVAVMAHPGLTGRDEIIPALAAAGLDGIEIYHPIHNVSARKRYRLLAKKFRLAMTGGSDSHNRKGRHGDIGDERVPVGYFEGLRARWASTSTSILGSGA